MRRERQAKPAVHTSNGTLPGEDGSAATLGGGVTWQHMKPAWVEQHNYAGLVPDS